MNKEIVLDKGYTNQRSKRSSDLLQKLSIVKRDLLEIKAIDSKYKTNDPQSKIQASTARLTRIEKSHDQKKKTYDNNVLRTLQPIQYNNSLDSDFGIPATKQVKKSSGSNKQSSDNISIPDAGKIIKPVDPRISSDLNDSDIEIPPSKGSFEMFNSIKQVKIPKTRPFGESITQIEDKITSGQGLLSLDSYFQFRKLKLLVNNKLQTQDILHAFSFQIFQLLHYSEIGRQTLLDIKEQSFLMNFDPKLYQSSWKIIKVHAGSDISDLQIKRLFLEYLIKIFENEASVPIVQTYYVLADILTMIVKEHVRLHVGLKVGEQFEQASMQKKADLIYPLYQEPFGISYRKQGNKHLFEKEGKTLIIEETATGYRSWIE